jgi:putative redox protein
MSEVTAKLQWINGLQFNVNLPESRKVELNSADEMGKAFTPMELFLVALAGCSAMDLQWIMEKQRQKVDKFEVSIRGVRRDEDPRYYESITVEYSITGQNISKDTVERAIRLSHEKYCSVKAMIKDSVRIDISYAIADSQGTKQKFHYPALTTPITQSH